MSAAGGVVATSAPRFTISPEISSGSVIRASSQKGITMTLYARSDLASISIPATSGGCNSTHSRPVVKGAPAKVWKLECPPCESVLRGDAKPKKLVYETDKRTGQTIRQARVPDASDQWSST